MWVKEQRPTDSSPALLNGHPPGSADLSCAPLDVRRLGLVAYEPTWELQRSLAVARRDHLIDDTLLLVEHPHTYTLGRRGKREHILLPPDELDQLGIEVYEIDRGGDVTYHGPGQLLAYPILLLDRWGRDVKRHMRNLEEVIIQSIARFGVRGGRIEGLTGVWVGDEKVAAIGVRVSYWVTTHGFALNVDPDMSYFAHIVPCGIADRGVTSLARLLGKAPAMRDVEDAVVKATGAVFGITVPHVGRGAD
jgi:lipoyl(octanoyl) transferase